ncbi:MAG: hypothetical protein U5L95_05640 [Candidatus Saccharibacteria bacterium]|nr:hypothetical protein [Candidatus Saccharibacteria bacterium]
MKLKLNDSGGYSIIEIVVVLAVFAVAIPALVLGVNNLILLNERARNRTLANSFAESKAEELRGAGFNALPLGTTSDISGELPPQLPSPKGASYEVVNDTPGLAEITITIDYNDYGDNRELQYKTNISELGVGQ